MSSKKREKQKIRKKPIENIEDEINIDNHENNIKIIRRTLENNTHIVIEDTKLKNVTSWRKSESKFLKFLIFNILSFGILHIISLFKPKLYLKLYCKPWPPKECDYFLVENIYGKCTLCSKIHKKSKNHNIYYDSETIKGKNITSSLVNYNKNEHYITRTLSYSFIYKSVTYEYNEVTNEIIPVYMNLTKMTNRGIIEFFSEGLSNDNIVKKYLERYGKNEYNINMGIAYLYFRKIESLYLLFTLIIQSINLFFKDFILFFIVLAIVLLLLLTEFIITRKIIYNLYEKEYTLDGENTKLKVKRKKNKNDINEDFFVEIKVCDLLPGDIVYLKTNDLVPCDCLILEGECIANEDVLNGNLVMYKKTSLSNNNEKFSYKLNRNNLLYHGMKIIKTISKLNKGYISVLCINTGPNTFKANLYSNILYLFERKKEYVNMYSIFGENRKNILFLILVTFLISILLGCIFPLFVNVNYEFLKNIGNDLFRNSLIRLICKSCMPVLFITNSIIYYIGIFHLKNENIFCFEKSKILIPGNIDTIFFGKTGILCESDYEINAFHPIHKNHQKSLIGYKTYNLNQCKEMNSQLLKYYKNFLNKGKYETKKNINKAYLASNECVTVFLECLLSCNNIEKFNTEIFGNSVETTIFKKMKWDIKSYRFNSHNSNNNNFELANDYAYFNNFNNDNNNFFFDNDMNLIDKNINDIYPNNYYKITESYKNEDEIKNKIGFTRFNSKSEKPSKKSSLPKVTEFSILPNIIIKNICESHIISYKLRIFKRFIKNGTLNSSAIVYNFITNELKFMTKGIPEYILDKCDKNTIPDNFDNIISFYRRKGFVLIICAYKTINIDSYKDSNTIEEYMKNLIFCGFISLKNKLKKEIINSIKALREFNCNLIISTGDNVFNCLPIGFDSSIIENKNIFAIDKEDRKISITKIYSIKKESDDEDEDSTQSLEKDSKETATCRASSSNHINRKKTLAPKYKKESVRNKEDSSLNQGHEDSDKRTDNIMLNSNKSYNESIKKSRPNARISENDKNSYQKTENTEKTQKNSFISVNKITGKEKESRINIKPHNVAPLNFQEKINKKYKSRQIEYEQEISTSRKFLNKIEAKTELEKHDFYPEIFEEHEDLSNNCIYSISGKAFNYLYKNKRRKVFRKLLEKIHQNCKIFFNMSSIDKSLAIDFFREFPKTCVCTIGKYPNDYDAVMTSNVGISLSPPKNENTILCHFYSADSSILSLKKIIREGRTISENIILLKITSFFYTIILNSYILSCLYYKIDIEKSQLNYLEICFLILSISAFTVQYNENQNSNPLIQNKRLFFLHYAFQIFGIFFVKILSIYLLYKFYIFNELIEENLSRRIFRTYFFILCVEQLFSVFFVFNFISFYRKNPLNNIFFVIFNLLIIFYFIILITLCSSNYHVDFFRITSFEYNVNLLDSFDDNNRLTCFLIYFTDFFFCFIYSRIVYFIFDRLSKSKSKKILNSE